MKKITLILIFLSFNLTFSQGFTKNEINNGFGQTRGIEIADLNNDGHLDVIGLTVDDTPEVAFWLNNEASGFGNKIIVDDDLEDYGNNGDDITVLDVNNDGFLDIITSVQFSFDNKLVWYPNNKDGTFGNRIVIDSGGGSSNDIVIMDVDNNGFDDILIVYTFYPGVVDGLYYFPNSGSGTFNSKELILETEIKSFSKAKLNDDSFYDLVFDKSGANSGINRLINNGDGTFGTNFTIDNTQFPPNYISVGRVNNDQFDDIIVSFISPTGTFAWYAGDGTGNFGSINVISDNEYDQITHSEIADLDSDGDKDIVATAYFSTDLIWWENDGNGNFGSAKIIDNETPFSYDVKSVDMDQDGELDIFVSNATGISWYKNNRSLSNGSFQLDNHKIVIFPNPSNGRFTINSSEVIKEIKVFNVLGKIVFKKSNVEGEIDLTNIQKGIYLLEIKNQEGETLKSKIVKE